MGTLLMLVGGLLLLVAFFCNILVIIDAFKNEVWKGIVFILCGLYGLYYTLVEFQHEKRGLILLGVFGGAIVGYGLLFAGGAMTGSMGPSVR